MSDFLEKLLIWDNSFLLENEELSKSIKDSILGGNNVHMTKLKDLFKEDGFGLIDANSKEFVIGKPKKNNPIKIILFDK